MKKDKSSLVFWLTVCVLVVCVALAKDSNHTSQAKSNTDVVYPDYYYAKTSDDTDTVKDKATSHTSQVQQDSKQEDIVNIDETFVPLADTMVEETSTSVQPQASTKNTVQKSTSVPTASQSSVAIPASVSILERKSQILSDMAQSSVLANSTQALANAVITAKTVKYQTLVTGAAVGVATIPNQRREAVLDLVEAKQKARTDRVNRIINRTGETTRNALDTALTIHNDLKQNADKIESDIKDTIDKIHHAHDEIKDILDKLGEI